MKKINILFFMVIVLVSSMFFSCNENPVDPRSNAYMREPTPPPPQPVLYYSQFGARGDGVTCDFNAIRRTHEAANVRGATVRADPGRVFYIGATVDTISIRTDTDWRGAKFIIDDTTVEMRGNTWAHSWIFTVESDHRPFNIYNISSLRKFQPTVPLNLGRRVMIEAVDNTTIRFIRSGGNQNAGDFQRDVFIVEEDGTVFPDAPIIWDFNNISSMRAFPIDEHQLTIKGGHFTRIAHIGGNHIQPYMWRGIHITRSNVLVDGMYHEVVGEAAPIVAYLGHLYITHAVDVTIQNTTLSGRLVHGGKGTYDILVETSINLTLRNVVQRNDITDPNLWGIFASNYSKNMLFDNVRFSRFDAHAGVWNATILNSEIGRQGIQVIGGGTLRIENTIVRGAPRYVQFRSDYGSTWEGNVYIRNGTLVLGTTNGNIIETQNNGLWNFGYETFMPRFIYIDGFHVQNSLPSIVNLVTNSQFVSGREQVFPYIKTERIYIRDFSSGTGNSWVFPNNMQGTIPVETLAPSWQWPWD